MNLFYNSILKYFLSILIIYNCILIKSISDLNKKEIFTFFNTEGREIKFIFQNLSENIYHYNKVIS